MREEGSDGVFELLGLDEPAVAVYRTMLLRPNLTRAEIAEDAEVDVVAVDDILTRLTARKLLRPSQLDPAGLRTESPEVALRRLLSEREADLHRQQESLGETWRAAAGLIEEYRQSRHDLTSEDVERLTTPDTTVSRLNELMMASERSIDTIVTIPPPARLLEMAKSEDATVLDRGVRSRTLYPVSVRHDPATMEYLRWYVDRGGQARSALVLPTRMQLHDTEAAVVALDPSDLSRGAVVVHTPGIVAGLQALFEELWADAEELVTCEDRGGAPSAEEIELLRVLARGAKDESAARTLGVSVRTVRRMIAALSERLDAPGRFAMGAEAAHRGWI